MFLKVTDITVITDSPTSAYSYAEIQLENDTRTIAINPATLQVDQNDPRKGDRSDPDDGYYEEGGWVGLDLEVLDKALAAFGETGKVRRIRAF